ncbi:MAP kinase-activated protein kinase 5 isoform X2 [Pan paniscus]|uniref:MAP kinase-activated protein kinase 5 isoform X2 n=1 Tax=Pan paniscus TaxID=9597 RepID=UPI00155F7EFE|nr:MAP kinase-activated protein kinase 5 isoform X2 [Pan paniscus]
MSEESDMDKAIKETSILEEYSINWTQKLGAGISGPVRVCVKKSTQERFALKILLDRPKARNEIALALRHCHLLNIAHRDLKPENLLFKDNSLDAPVKLCDFGFAKIDQGDLMTPQFTPYYVAPQVLEAQRRHQKEKSGIIPTSPTPYTYNKSCDLWSLGVIIYVMLCGYPPFYSKHHSRTIPKDMRRKIMTGSFEFPEEEWSQISEMAKDVVRKLLKVKPEERLTIEGVLDHPWLNSTEALDNVLPSAQLMMDKAVVAGIQQAHAEQLANMRIQDLKVSLKPLHSVNNPILRKRKLLGTKPKDSVYIHDHENGAEDSNVALEKLRDVIAQCILPQAGKGENEDEKLNEVMQEAWKYNRECKLLRDTLQSFSWNGRGFTDKVDRLKLAEIVKQLYCQDIFVAVIADCLLELTGGTLELGEPTSMMEEEGGEPSFLLPPNSQEKSRNISFLSYLFVKRVLVCFLNLTGFSFGFILFFFFLRQSLAVVVEAGVQWHYLRSLQPPPPRFQ